uniref:Uncharacterized protein n=1 Tax=Magnetococcus massalia (strain MO-1) TaxID=451514 RepID=A0A1S7LG30_MAGMO|nr:conserved protein of unknown function [Candidatus Magnetococcus massalia]
MSKNFRARGASIPAPTGGWNARDDIASMDKDEALVLDNLFPGNSYVSLRSGYQPHSSELGSSVESLMPWHSSRQGRLFAAAGGHIYDVTAAGTVGDAMVSGFTSDQWQFVNYKDRLFICNGVDAPQTWDGSSWQPSNWSGSGLTPGSLTTVTLFKQRLWYVERSSAKVWYGEAGAVSGTLLPFDLSQFAPHGGYLMAMGSWSIDGGDGMDDMAVFIMSEGDVLVYQGINPNQAGDWLLVGTFKMGKPVGRRCLTKLGPELVVITQDGYQPLSKVLGSGRSGQRQALSDRISRAVREAVAAYGGKFGWQICHHPKRSQLIFNLPSSGRGFEQHVMNTSTGAWCRFTGLHGICWAMFDDRLYFGSHDGTIYEADRGTDDNGSDILADLRTSFQYYGGHGNNKRFTMLRPVLSSDAELPLAITFDTDFAETPPNDPISSSYSASTAIWDNALWDEALWGGGMELRAFWQSVNGIGYCASVRLRTATGNQSIRWHAMDLQYETGSGL